jgi:hypothetical protein
MSCCLTHKDLKSGLFAIHDMVYRGSTLYSPNLHEPGLVNPKCIVP